MSIGETPQASGFEGGLPILPQQGGAPQADIYDVIYYPAIKRELRTHWPEDIVFSEEIFDHAVADAIRRVDDVRSAELRVHAEGLPETRIASLVSAVVSKALEVLSSVGTKKMKTA